MNASQDLRTAFWALTASLGLVLLLVGFHPDTTETAISLARALKGTAVGESRFDGAAAEATVTAQLDIDQLDIDQRFPALADNRREDKPVERNSQSAAVAPRGSKSDPVAGDSARGPSIQLGTIEEVDSEPASDSHASGQSTASFDRELNAQLASLQTAVEQLQQTDSDRRTNELERAAQQLKQTQQSQRLRELELRLQRLQSPGPATPKNTQPTAVTQRSVAAIDAAPDRFSLQIRHAEITDVLELLGQTTGYNIVIGEGVSGTVPSANLRNVTIVEALDSILPALELTFEEDGRFIHVLTKAEHAARKSAAAKASAER